VEGRVTQEPMMDDTCNGGVAGSGPNPFPNSDHKNDLGGAPGAADARPAPAIATEADTATADALAAYDYAALWPEEHRDAFGEITDAMKGIAGIDAERIAPAIRSTFEAIGLKVHEQYASNWNKQADANRAESEKLFSKEDLGNARAALLKVFDLETAKHLEAMRFTEHPQLIAAMLRVHRAIADDTWVSGNAAAPNGSDARAMFPKSNMNP
jgi:hypothetical protein